VKKDDHNKFSLPADQVVEPFTKEESHLIQEVLSVSVKNNPLVASITSKLPSLEESNILATNIVHGHLAKLVAKINDAITHQTQLLIQRYQSANTESISDRLVEPIGFTANYQYLCAFEVESKQNKYFKLERMGSIEILTEIVKFKELHQLLNPDVFGFSVKLKLSMRAMLFLKDDYPATADFLTEQKDGSWLLNVEVNSMEPVERIVRGMPGEVEIVDL
jgi:predicted DNA-binding transcriptional regulator YafY